MPFFLKKLTKCIMLFFCAGADKASQCKLCISNLDTLHEELLLAGAKFDKFEVDADPKAIKKFRDEVQALNERAEHHMDAAKLVRNKLKSFLSSQ